MQPWFETADSHKNSYLKKDLDLKLKSMSYHMACNGNHIIVSNISLE